MVDQNTGRQQIIRELIACQDRVRELEKNRDHDDELLGAKATYDDVFELTPNALIVVDRKRRIRNMNAAAENLFGYSRAELIGKDHDVLVPQRLLARHAEEMKEYLEQPRVRIMGIGLDLWGRRKDGSEFPADIDLGPMDIGGESVVLAVVRDVTSRKQIEINLEQSEQRYRSLVELSPDAVVVSREGKIVFINVGGAKLYGAKSGDELVGRTMVDFVHPECRKMVVERRMLVQRGETAPLIELRMLRKDGGELYVESISMPMVYQGQPSVLSVIHNITERKKLEQELNRYRKRLEDIVAERTLELARTNQELAREVAEHQKAEAGLSLRATMLDNVAVAIFLLNSRGDVVYANEAASATYGYSREEFVNLNVRRLLPPQDVPLVEARLKRVLENRHLELETVHIRRDGSRIPVEVRHSLIKTAHGEFIVSAVRESVPCRPVG